MTTIDDRARRAADQLRAAADASVDHEAGLNRIHHSAGGASGGRAMNTPRLLVAAAAVAVIVAGITVLTTRPASAPVANQPDVEEPLPTVAPITVAPSVPAATVPTDTTQPPTETTPPSTVPTTAPPAPTEGVAAIPVLDVAPLLVPLDLPACGPVDCSVASDASGKLVALDARTGTFTVDVDGWQATSTVTPAEPLGDQAYLVAIGPGLIAYVAALGDPDQAPAMDLLAVALEGDRAGQVLRRLPGVVDGSGDTDLARTAQGLVAVGCCGSDTLRPDPGGEPIMPWLTPDGEPTVEPGPHVSVVLDGAQVYGVLTPSDGPPTSHLIPANSWFRGMPLAAVVGERDYLLSWAEVDGAQRLVRVSGTVGLVQEIVVPEGLSVLGLNVHGAVLFDGGQYFRWHLPSLALPRDATAQFAPVLPAGANDPEQIVEAVLAHLRATDACENPSGAQVAGTQANSDDSVTTWINHSENCDDSVGGAWIQLDLASDGTTWRLERATSWPLCLRGGTDLCV